MTTGQNIDSSSDWLVFDAASHGKESDSDRGSEGRRRGYRRRG
jgi:hypothetical protein